MKLGMAMGMGMAAAAWAGPNQNATLRVDVDYTTAAVDTVDTVGVTGSVWLSVRVADAVYLDTYGFYLGFDTAKMSFVRGYAGTIGYDNFLEARGGTMVGFIARLSILDSTRITVGNGLSGQDSSRTPSGEGLLALFQFNLKGVEGEARFSLNQIQLLDWQQTLDTAITVFGASLMLQRPTPILAASARRVETRSGIRERVRLALVQSPRTSGHLLLGRLRAY